MKKTLKVIEKILYVIDVCGFMMVKPCEPVAPVVCAFVATTALCGLTQHRRLQPYTETFTFLIALTAGFLIQEYRTEHHGNSMYYNTILVAIISCVVSLILRIYLICEDKNR